MKRELVFNSVSREIRVALLEDGLPAEIYVERSRTPGIIGNIYRGLVSNVLPGMRSAFVDIGLDRDAFLSAADLLVPSDDSGEAPARAEEDVGCFLKEGHEVMVQVTKEALGGKGPRVTTQISLPGRTLVFLPGGTHRAVSRRIEPEDEKVRLLRIVEALPVEGGFIARTAAAGAMDHTLREEAEGLRAQWGELTRLAAGMPVPSCVHAETDLALKILRDLFTPDVERVVIDREETYRRCRDFAQRLLPGLAHRVERYSAPEAIFEAFGVEQELDRALRRRVWLPSGGFIVIHPTEALVAIDVNTGRYLGKTRFEETALRTNVEAAREIVRQIRLRDLGGILVIDFIDLEEEESRNHLVEVLEAELRRDRAKSRVLQISEFGLVEITRQRVRRSLEGLLCRSCPTCRGSGRVRSAETIVLDIQRQMRKVVALLGEGTVTIRAHPEVASVLKQDLDTPEEGFSLPGKIRIQIEGVEEFHPEQHEIVTR